MISRYYHFELQHGLLLIRASHPRAKQVLWGWAGDYASTRDEGAIQLYGREDFVARQERDEVRGPMSVDWAPWLWRLDTFGVRSLRQAMELELADPAKYESKAFEQRRCRELLAGIEKMMPKRG